MNLRLLFSLLLGLRSRQEDFSQLSLGSAGLSQLIKVHGLGGNQVLLDDPCGHALVLIDGDGREDQHDGRNLSHC